MNFKDFTRQGTDKMESREEKIVVIVGFLAMLELVRQGIIEAMQESSGGDIIMERQTVPDVGRL